MLSHNNLLLFWTFVETHLTDLFAYFDFFGNMSAVSADDVIDTECTDDAFVPVPVVLEPLSRDINTLHHLC